MNATLSALDRGIEGYPHGMLGMAEDLKKPKEVLRKEMDGGPSHKLGAIQAVYMAKLMCKQGGEHCYDFAAHVAEECGGTFTPGAAAREVDKTPVQKLTCIARETADITSVVIEAMGDGVITDNELGAIEAEIAQAEEALRKLRQAARAVNLAGKPAHVRAVVELPVRETTTA